MNVIAERRKPCDILGILTIPEDWDVWKLAHCFHIGSGTTPPTGNIEFFDGEIPWVTTSELRERVITDTDMKLTPKALEQFPSLRLHPAGALLVAMYGATIGRLGLLGVEACTNQACCVLAKPKNVDAKFAFYWLLAFRSNLIGLSSGGGQPNLNMEKVASLRITAPDQESQRRIVAFLDRETARIDEMIAKKERLIALLEEKRTATISHVVRTGLGPAARTRDTGFEGWGKIPAKWQLKELRFLTAVGRPILYGIVLPGPNVTEGVPIVKGGNCEPGRLRLECLSRTTFEIDSTHQRSRLNAGDIVYAIRGSIGMTDIIPDELAGANITQDAARIAPRSDVNRRWLLHALRSSPFFSGLDAGATGATIRGINICDLQRARIAVPPLAEQAAIGDYLDATTSKLDVLVNKNGVLIDHLREHRSALIFAAVTGKIDVREAS